MKPIKNEVKIALVGIVAIVILYFGMQFLKGLTMLSSGNNYYAHFKDVSGLSASSPVYANGYRVGVVEGIDYDYSRPDNVVATIGLDNRMQLPRGTRAEITSDLLGNVKLELRFGDNPLDLLQRGDTIEGGAQEGLMSKAGAMVPQIEVMLPKLDSILTSVNVLLADPAIRNSLGNIEDITANLTTTTRQLNQLSAELNHQVPQMLVKVDTMLENTNGLTRQFNDINLPQTMQRVDNTMANLEQTTAAMNSREGTLGLLMHDAGLYRNLNATMNSADSLLIDLRQHPKRYVHFSLFGRKDK
jgi:phospholipid/cholesterol/gamma-HCH transport system substrate-binding protein